MRIEQVNRESIKWKKNEHSHFCEAAWYAVIASLLYMRPGGRRVEPEEQRVHLRSPVYEIHEAMARSRGHELDRFSGDPLDRRRNRHPFHF